MEMQKDLLGAADIRKRTGLGRDLTFALMEKMPHITTGKAGHGTVRVVRSTDLDLLLARAAEERRDLWQIARDFTPDTLRDWMRGGVAGAN